MITFALKRNFVQTKAEPSLLELCWEQPKFMNEVHKLWKWDIEEYENENPVCIAAGAAHDGSGADREVA